MASDNLAPATLAPVESGATSTAESCSSELTWDPWAFDADTGPTPSYGPGASQWDEAPATTPVQAEIPAEYRRADPAELQERISAARSTLGTSVVVLGHHYQRDDVIRWADFTGDSFKLSRQAATRTGADAIVFCGVHFMAETADILTAPAQQVVLPNLAAGCSMADMATDADVSVCWDQLDRLLGGGPGAVIPVTYMNSAASLKAFCGRRGGIVCTSSNARAVLEWAFARGSRVLFFPDEHLGRNTGVKLGLPDDRMVVWDPALPLGGASEAALRQAALILWKGWCSVHTRFTVEQIERARREHPEVSVIVHPECRREVVEAADADGSTERIIETIGRAAPGSTWAVGTEINLVNRLARAHPDKRVFCLDPVICPCSTMYRIHPAYLAWVFERLVEGEVVNRIRVDEETRNDALVALERMLAVT